jgi:hypothetical protein
MARTQEVDETAAEELKLFIENDGDLYRQQTVPIMKNLMTKMATGKYRKSMAPKLWGYLAESGAKKYNREMGGGGSKWNEMFTKPTRDYVAARMAREFENAALGGEYDGMISQWVPKKYQSSFTTGRGMTLRNPSMPNGEYQGHPSYAHWNVSLWVGNDEGLYRMARSMSRADFARELPEMMPKTPDGVRVTQKTARYAWDGVHEDD